MMKKADCDSLISYMRKKQDEFNSNILSLNLKEMDHDALIGIGQAQGYAMAISDLKDWINYVKRRDNIEREKTMCKTVEERDKELKAVLLAIDKWKKLLNSELPLSYMLKRCTLCEYYDEPTNHHDQISGVIHECNRCSLAKIGYGCMNPGNYDDIHKILLKEFLHFSWSRLCDVEKVVMDQLTPLIGKMIEYLKEAEIYVLKEKLSCEE